ncbi:MAG: nitroreductase family protein [Longibaculum sp.]
MDELEAMKARHSVRRFQKKPIEKNLIDELNHTIETINHQQDLHIQLLTNEPHAFESFFVHYGRFKNVQNYIAMIGIKSDNLEEKIGYYGEQLVLKAQQLGLNTCWVAATYNSKKVPYHLKENEKLVCVIAIGYGENQGKPHKNMPVEKLYTCIDEQPEWFFKGLEAVMLAPTAMNQQKFFFTLKDKHVEISTHGSYAKIDLGILKYHFELGAHKTSEIWL